MPTTLYVLASKQPGRELVSTFVERPEGVSDEDYKNVARNMGAAVVRHMQEVGVAGRHFLMAYDALTREESEEQVRLSHAIEDAGGHLPDTAEVLASM